MVVQVSTKLFKFLWLTHGFVKCSNLVLFSQDIRLATWLHKDLDNLIYLRPFHTSFGVNQTKLSFSGKKTCNRTEKHPLVSVGMNHQSNSVDAQGLLYMLFLNKQKNLEEIFTILEENWNVIKQQWLNPSPAPKQRPAPESPEQHPHR